MAAGAVNLHAGKFANGKNQVAAKKNRIGRKDLDFRKNSCWKMGHIVKKAGQETP
jgi:hypothetical protein